MPWLSSLPDLGSLVLKGMPEKVTAGCEARRRDTALSPATHAPNLHLAVPTLGLSTTAARRWIQISGPASLEFRRYSTNVYAAATIGTCPRAPRTLPGIYSGVPGTGVVS